MDIAENLKKNRPELSVSTLKTYTSILKSLHKRVFGDADIKLSNFSDVESITEDLKDKPVSTRKTALSALYVLTNNKKYNDLMRDGIEEYKNDVDKREMSDKQKDAFKSQEEIKKIFDAYKTRAELLYKKEGRNVKDQQDIQDFIILALMSGVFLPPRRAEYVKFKIIKKNIDEEKDNFIRGEKEFVFNTFKGSEKKGTQVVPIPVPLRKILKKWIYTNPTEWLLHDVNGNALNSVKLNQRLNKIFGKGFSINGLRHSYLSSKYQDTIKLNEEMKKDMEKMGSSVAQQNIYIQKIEK